MRFFCRCVQFEVEMALGSSCWVSAVFQFEVGARWMCMWLLQVSIWFSCAESLSISRCEAWRSTFVVLVWMLFVVGLRIGDGLTTIAMMMKLGRLCWAPTVLLSRVCCSRHMAISAGAPRVERRLRSRGWWLHDVCSWVAGVLMRLVVHLENARLLNPSITRPGALVCWCVGW